VRNTQATIVRAAESRLVICFLFPIFSISSIFYRILREGSIAGAIEYIVLKGEFVVLIAAVAFFIVLPMMIFYWTIPAVTIWLRDFVYKVEPNGIVVTQNRRFNVNEIASFVLLTFPRKRLRVLLNDGTSTDIESFLIKKENRALEEEIRDIEAIQLGDEL